MTTFDEREKGFEAKLAHDQELKFRATVRRNKWLGLWAAQKLGRAGEAADTVTGADFIAALEDSRATVTEEMEEEYDRVMGELKQRAAQVQPIGFVHEGMVRSTRSTKRDQP